LSEHQTVVYFCLSFCRAFNCLLSQVLNESIEDCFDMLIVANLTDDETLKDKPKKAFIDQVGIF